MLVRQRFERQGHARSCIAFGCRLGGGLGQKSGLREQRSVSLLLCLRLPCLCDATLLDGNSALPVRETGKRQRDDEAGGETASEDVAPPGRAVAAFGHEGLRLRGRLRRAARARADPALGLL
jgi:hypothetical protein